MKSYLIIFLSSFLTIVVNAQDQIVKTSGDEIFGKVIRVNALDIVYKKKENMDGPEYSELKSNILFIKYENGTKEIFTTANTPVVNNVSTLCAPIKRKNSVFFEGGGNGIFGSLNYERRFFASTNNNFGTIKLGISPFTIFNVVNITSTYNIGDGMNYFEIGGGIGSYIYGGFGAYNQDQSYFFFTPTIGYRRQSAGGFMLRTYISMLTLKSSYTTNTYYTDRYGNDIYTESYKNEYYPFLGISIGYSF